MAKGKRKKILVVDDCQENVYTLKEILEEEGYNVVTALTGAAAVRIAQTQDINIIICDIMMPEMNGFQVLEKLRSQANTSAIPFVFLSAKSEIKDVRQGLTLGADDYLTKPINRQEIVNTIKLRLSKKELYEQKLQELRQSISHALPHELKTPMVTILGFSQVIKTDVESLSSLEITEMAEIIYKSANRLNSLIQKILFFTKLEVLQNEETELQIFTSGSTIVNKQSLYAMAENVIEKYNRKNDFKIEVEDEEVKISNPNLRIIIEELIDNACKFSSAGEEISITGTLVGDEYFFYIIDAGRGMTEEQIASLGGYLQINRMLYEQPGIGLGLTIAKKICELHSGSCSIESIPGKKTLVSISLPVKKIK